MRDEFVQVFGRWNAETIRALWQPASEKRQGRKSRSAVQRRCGVRYGELAARAGVRSLDWSGCGNGFAAKHGWARRCERACGALNDEIGGAPAGKSIEPLRA